MGLLSQDIVEMALSIDRGHEICPECNGGRTKERSFTVWRSPGKIHYKCWRVSCGVSGYVPSGGSGVVEEKYLPVKKGLRPYTGDTRPLSDTELEYAWVKWGLNEEALIFQGVSADKATGRIVFPIYTKEGYGWGHQLRSIDGKGRKASFYWHSEYPERLHFPKGAHEASSSIWLVEDIPSAIRLREHKKVSTALLGSVLSTRQVRAVHSATWKRLFLALDKDATDKAIKAKQRYSLMFEKFTVVPLEKDIKNMSHDELESLLGANRED